MNIDIPTRKEIKEIVREEAEKKYKKDIELLWKYINKLREDIKINERRLKR